MTTLIFLFCSALLLTLCAATLLRSVPNLTENWPTYRHLRVALLVSLFALAPALYLLLGRPDSLGYLSSETQNSHAPEALHALARDIDAFDKQVIAHGAPVEVWKQLIALYLTLGDTDRAENRLSLAMKDQTSKENIDALRDFARALKLELPNNPAPANP